jgi:CRP/FNR family cyclic AMP-dependent transcriptional regulator
LSDLIYTDVSRRLAKRVVAFGAANRRAGGRTLRLSYDPTREELAHLVASSRETVKKAPADFSQRGGIRRDGKSMVITETEHLARRTRSQTPASARSR